MAWYEIVLLAAAVGLLIPVCVIFIRHFPQIAAIEVKELPEEKQQHIKVIMAEQRLLRKFKRLFDFMQKHLRPVMSLVKTMYGHWRERLGELEKQYKIEKLQVKSATESGRESLKQKVSLELKQARDATTRDDFEQAEGHYINVVQLDPQSVDAFEGLGEIYLAQKKFDEAKEVYRYLLKMMQEQDVGQIHLSLLNDHDQPEEQKSIIASERAKVHFQLSEVYLQQDELTMAEKELGRSLRLEPNNPRYLDALIDISIMNKNKVKAQEFFFRLKEVNPDNKKLKEIEQRISDI